MVSPALLPGYLPGKLYDLNASKYETEAELKALIAALHRRGIKAMADVVINHRTATKQDARGVWDDVKYGDDRGNLDSGEDGANWLKDDIDFNGWRFDFAKGYAPGVIEKTSPDFAVGEIWNALWYGQDRKPNYNQDAHRNDLARWVQNAGGRVSVFDFTTKGILQAAVGGEWWRMRDCNSKPPGTIGVMPRNSVTLLIITTQGRHRSFGLSLQTVIQGYAYILTHPGVPSIFYDHFFQWGLMEQIEALAAVRAKNGIHETSTVNILAAEADAYVAMIDGKVIVKIGPKFDVGNLIPPGFKVTISGKDYSVWEKNTQ
ncbi:Alpha-amylase-like protein [Drosera capensis]